MLILNKLYRLFYAYTLKINQYFNKLTKLIPNNWRGEDGKNYTL